MALASVQAAASTSAAGTAGSAATEVTRRPSRAQAVCIPTPPACPAAVMN
jgi:hypothetical protein